MGTTSSVRFSTDPLEVRSLGTLDYLAAWDLQRELVAERAADSGRDTLLLLEHPSVYTAGRRTAPEDRPTDGIPVIDVDRGGKITWHGPGQLVGYPIVKLAVPVDVVNYVRRIEEALISVCTDLGIGCGRVEGRSGVWLPASLTGGSWLPERKIAAIGVRMQRGVAMHGFAINCDADLGAFDEIIPCGIADAGVTSLSRELGRTVTVAEITPVVVAAVAAALDGELQVTEHDIERITFDEAAAAAPTRFTTHRFA
ncbi:lipoyl(octanoyl) transferase [Rhodococcus sp. PvR044]|jgi:lipoyl(octanoyl) transferase|uniref:lipoyl(octanoyl) transferase LipB n=1 Tax=Rhodococcus TaxID=1827 RepID=UPI000BD4BA60|nr:MULTISPECIES: lipoyl(octanoyl) transferase LipB [Rhodococcus]MBP1159297.1 lipoyl(octanoyl) transferase [Rhodococcus sp. PvR099]MCZ4556877.1 lipoyl(octanoyl) transferase LipB [Rhodococcus maanshanensis]PTR41944.1 lipoyl(octanoyl) transferase [Rhodococcus sp. OK611]SNX91609.1 lipoyl(octanoyl) transferase [Rhodococcus sp. OK270]